MEAIGNLWYVWLIGVLGSLIYLLYTSWEYFALITKEENLENDPQDKAITQKTLQSFWPLVSAVFFLILLALALFYKFIFL